MKTKLFFIIAPFLAIVLLAVAAGFAGCSTQEELDKKRAETYYLDEYFILADRKEAITYDSDRNEPAKIRTWVIYKEIPNTDSIDVAEILSEDGGVSADFIITTDLWFNKPVGSTLHFNYIRKDRFFRTTKKSLNMETNTKSTTVVTPAPVETPSAEPVDEQVIELERQKASIDREIESLKRIQK